MTQANLILDYLLNHPEGITPLEALEKFGIFRLGARIHDIRNGNTPSGKAYPVETINETKGGKTYARYRIPVIGGSQEEVFRAAKEYVAADIRNSSREINQGSDLPVEFVNINLLPERSMF